MRVLLLLYRFIRWLRVLIAIQLICNYFDRSHVFSLFISPATATFNGTPDPQILQINLNVTLSRTSK